MLTLAPEFPQGFLLITWGKKVTWCIFCSPSARLKANWLRQWEFYRESPGAFCYCCSESTTSEWNKQKIIMTFQGFTALILIRQYTKKSLNKAERLNKSFIFAFFHRRWGSRQVNSLTAVKMLDKRDDDFSKQFQKVRIPRSPPITAMEERLKNSQKRYFLLPF